LAFEKEHLILLFVDLCNNRLVTSVQISYHFWPFLEWT